MNFKGDKLTLTKAVQYITVSAITAPKRMDFIGTSFEAVRIAAKAIWGEFPIRLEDKDLPVVKGIAVAMAENGTAWKQIADSLEQYGKVELLIEQD